MSEDTKPAETVTTETAPAAPVADAAPAPAPAKPKADRRVKITDAKPEELGEPKVLERTRLEMEAGKSALARHSEIAAQRALEAAKEAPPVMVDRDNTLVPDFRTAGLPVA